MIMRMYAFCIPAGLQKKPKKTARERADVFGGRQTIA